MLDTPAEPEYDDFTRLAAFICQAPIAVISLVDSHRQWFKSRLGIDSKETNRDHAFCAHAILSHETLIVNDAVEDPRFADSPLVTDAPGIRFYAGAPLVTPAGYAIGALCAIDRKPRRLSTGQAQALQVLARQVVAQLELRKVCAGLNHALKRVRLLEGIVPICSYCKGIRNDQGYWSRVERFIEEHANVKLTHGICPDCMEKYFGGDE